MAVVPGMSELTAPYWAAAREGRLVVQECRSCRQVWHPPLPRCPHCHAAGPGWRPVSGAGTVYTYTVVRHATHHAFAGQIPYVLAIIELAEGPRLVTALVDVEPDEPGEPGGPGEPSSPGSPGELGEPARPGEVRAGQPVRVGLPVRVVFREVADGVTLPYFAPAAGQEPKDSGARRGGGAARRR